MWRHRAKSSLAVSSDVVAAIMNGRGAPPVAGSVTTAHSVTLPSPSVVV